MNKIKISNKNSYIILAVIILISLLASTFFMLSKQGFHEDELLTYNLANSSFQLDTDGNVNTSDDFNRYLTVDPGNRFDAGLVIENQIIDASHPPLYYLMVNTVCSLFPGFFSKWLAFSVNAAAMIGILLILFKTAKSISKSNLWALTAVCAYALSIACITTTIYLRMYATLTFFVLSFIYTTIKIYNTNYSEKRPYVRYAHLTILFFITMAGILTQYYFILFACLTGVVFLVFTLKDRQYFKLAGFVAAALLAAAAAFAVYPYIISNVLGGNRGLGSLSFNVDAITIVTYVFYKLATYVQIMAKELFVNQVWLAVLCLSVVVGFAVYARFFKKLRLSRNAVFAAVPSIVFFVCIALISPFNSDRYVMASLPLIVMLFVFAFVKIAQAALKYIKHENAVKKIVPAAVVLTALCGIIFVKPYYTYGKTNLYEPQSESCIFVCTAMLEWNKCIDKLMQYEDTRIVKTDKMSPSLGDELEAFATERGVITNGKISEMAKAYMNNGETNRTSNSSISALADGEALKDKDSVTVYVSRLADNDYVLDYIKENTKFKNCKLIQKDYDFDEFFNWYDYFAETESYCNVYLFY